jgi:hypothetical protein
MRDFVQACEIVLRGGYRFETFSTKSPGWQKMSHLLRSRDKDTFVLTIIYKCGLRKERDRLDRRNLARVDAKEVSTG